MGRRLFYQRKGADSPTNASGAAFLILVITLLVIFYILFLPPSDRDALLTDEVIPGTPSQVSGGYSHLLGTTPLSVTVGHIDYISQSTIEHTLASFRVYTQTQANVIHQEASLYVKNSAFATQSKQISFGIDKTLTENVQLSFNVYRPQGRLQIYLNGNQVFEGQLTQGTPQPIALPQHLLKNENTLFFSVSSPGFAFWRVHQYELHNIILTGDVTDETNSVHQQKFYIGDSEKEHMEQATLSFFPDCDFDEIDNLVIYLNQRQLYSGTPDCGITNYITLNPDELQEGENSLEFVSQQGSYIIDMPEIEVELEDAQYPIHYFDLHEDLFIYEVQDDTFCGKIDGVCPANCEHYEDKDCCFDQSNDNYWCDVEPNNPFQRCVNDVLASTTGDCPSGYEDQDGNPHEDFEGQCGDDTDGNCPTNCSPDFDKDCCFDLTGQDPYWCEDTPLTGQSETCTSVITPSDCDACPNGYLNEDGEAPNCPTNQQPTYYDEPLLKAGVDVILDVYFTHDQHNKVDFIINGNTIPVDTYNLHFLRNINLYVREGSNSIVVEPRKDVDIAQLKVRVG